MHDDEAPVFTITDGFRTERKLRRTIRDIRAIAEEMRASGLQHREVQKWATKILQRLEEWQ